jgi:energy-coupling factor transport system ATP-binding protein
VTLSLVGVGYRYPGARAAALLDVTVEVARGDIVGVAGRSESGKTTLCLVATGLAPRATGGLVRGAISLDGVDTDSWPMHRISQHVAMGFQTPSTQLSGVVDTVFEEVAFGPMNLGLVRAEVIERTREAMHQLRIDHLAHRDPWRLSGGQQQLVALAGLVAMRPAYLVLDEPTAQLDPEGTRLVSNAMVDLARSGTGILLAEQKADVLARVASSTIVLQSGRVALSGPTDRVLADHRLGSLGVTPPAEVRLRAAALATGVETGRLEEALSDA